MKATKLKAPAGGAALLASVALAGGFAGGTAAIGAEALGGGTEGQPAYGPIKVSLTKRGDTSPASGLAVARFPTTPHGEIHYDRQTQTSKFVARAIRRGEAVVVVHGVDYNNNRKYDFHSADKSELDPSLPAEATDPATCGVLRVQAPTLP